MKRKRCYVILVLVLWGLISCNSSETGVASGHRVLPPEVWLQKYNEAWAICERLVPRSKYDASSFLDPVEDITIISTLLKERSSMVENVVANEFPDLYEYIQIPAYRDLLKKQTQSVYEQIIRENYLEAARVNQDIETQTAKYDQLLKSEKEQITRFLDGYDNPDYVP